MINAAPAIALHPAHLDRTVGGRSSVPPLRIPDPPAAMSFIRTDPSQIVRLKLARDRTRTLKQGYPWIYRDWLTELPPAPAGSRALV